MLASLALIRLNFVWWLQKYVIQVKMLFFESMLLEKEDIYIRFSHVFFLSAWILINLSPPPPSLSLSLSLSLASARDQPECVKYLLQRGAKPNSTNDDSRTALHIACAKGFGSVARVLLANGVDVNGKVKTGRERQKVVVGFFSCMPSVHAKIQPLHKWTRALS